ncbi:MAG TPA: hypothetical protein VEL07_09590, partial [Planctomycetota bacterium]|nr:hypothetical protein [Planctomycetota bacterium]
LTEKTTNRGTRTSTDSKRFVLCTLRWRGLLDRVPAEGGKGGDPEGLLSRHAGNREIDRSSGPTATTTGPRRSGPA